MGLRNKNKRLVELIDERKMRKERYIRMKNQFIQKNAQLKLPLINKDLTRKIERSEKLLNLSIGDRNNTTQKLHGSNSRPEMVIHESNSNR